MALENPSKSANSPYTSSISNVLSLSSENEVSVGLEERLDDLTARRESNCENMSKDWAIFNYAQHMEPKKTRRWRYFSLAVICFTAFIYALAFSIVLNSAKPYLDKMDPDAGTRFLGIFIASQAVAQLFSSPLLGFLANKFGSVRWLLMLSILITGCGFAFYASVGLLPPPRRWYLFSARLTMGLAGGSSTLCYSYVASATTVKERSTALSILQMSKSVAIIIGPLIQASFLPLGTGEDHPIGDSGLYWNVYTAPAWLAVLLCIMNVAVLLPCVFTEYHMAKEEGDYLVKMHLKKEEDDGRRNLQKRKPDKTAMVVCIVLFSIFQFNFNVLESLLTMEQLGMSPEQSIFSVSIFFSAAGVYNTLCFAAVGYLSRKFGDRKLLSFGIICIFLGPLCMYPYGGPPPPLKAPNVTESLTTTMTPSTVNTGLFAVSLLNSTQYETFPDFPDECADITVLYNGGGCPALKQYWCCHTPAIHAFQIILGYFFLITSVPVGITMSNGILSKILGPYPQGSWTGLLGAGSALARILCPLSVTNLYTSFGTGPTFGFLTSVLSASAVLFVIFYKRLIPYRYDLPASVVSSVTTIQSSTSNELDIS